MGDWQSAVLQLFLALIASGVMVKLLTLRQDRRKIAGEASSQEANAASVLTGASLKMVESAQRDAINARKEASACRVDNETLKARNEELWIELNRTRWKVHNLEVREAVLEAALRDAGIIVPSRPPHAEETHDFPPPDDGAPATVKGG